MDRHLEELSGKRELAALLLELPAEIGDEGQEAVRIVSQRAGVPGPLHLVPQKPLGPVAVCPCPLGDLIGGSCSPPGLLGATFGPFSPQPPVLGLLPRTLGDRPGVACFRTQ